MAIDFESLAVAEAAARYDLAAEAAAKHSEAREQSAALSVRVFGGLSGNVLCGVGVTRATSVRALKACVAQRVDVPASQQQLFLTVAGGRRLCDDEMLCDFAVGSEALDVALIRLEPDRVRTMEGLRSGRAELRHMSQALRSDPDVVLAALEHTPEALQHASDSIRSERFVVHRAICRSGLALRHAAEDLKADKGMVLAAVEQDPDALEYASPAMRRDQDVVFAAVRRDGLAVRHATEDCRGDPALALAAVEQDGLALQHLPADLKGNFDIVLRAVTCKGAALRFAAPPLRADRSIVLAAVRSSEGAAVEFAAEALRGEKDVMLEAVRLTGLVLRSASRELRQDREVVSAAVGCTGSALELASEELRGDREVVLAAVRRCGSALRHASDALRGEPSVVLAAVQRDGLALRFAAAGALGNRAVVLAAVRSKPLALRFAPEALKADSLFRAGLQELGFFDDDSFEEFLLVEPELVRDMVAAGDAILLDARGVVEFAVSHVAGACPVTERLVRRDLAAAPSDAPLLRVLLDRADQAIIVYSDNGLSNSRCMGLAKALRQDDRIQAGRVLRLSGGLNAWKQARLPVEGDARLMLLGEAVREGELRRFLEGGTLRPWYVGGD